MEARKWEDLNEDCLVKVFERVGLKTLVFGVTFVCKPWYQATLSPNCWKTLNFQELDDEPTPEFIKSVFKRSRGAAIKVFLTCCSPEVLNDISDECPALKVLDLPYVGYRHHLPSLIHKWKDLQMLFLYSGSSSSLEELLTQISVHCKKFWALFYTNINIGYDAGKVYALASLLPNLLWLSLEGSILPRESLKLILAGCQKLQILNVRDCIGLAENDDEILKMASHIKCFDSRGARLELGEDDVVDDCDYVYTEELVHLIEKLEMK